MEKFQGPYIKNTPHINVFDIKDKNKIGILLASSGLWNMYNSYEITNMFKPNTDHFLNDIISDYIKKTAAFHNISIDKLRKIPVGMKKDYYEDVSLLYYPLN